MPFCTTQAGQFNECWCSLVLREVSILAALRRAVSLTFARATAVVSISLLQGPHMIVYLRGAMHSQCSASAIGPTCWMTLTVLHPGRGVSTRMSAAQIPGNHLLPCSMSIARTFAICCAIGMEPVGS
eukprot:scaffold91982_cov30-Tisochrysis_lutea.AAC.5